MFFFSQLRSSTESNKRSVESLETKLSKIKAEWESSKLAHEATRAEFESYKVRYTVRRANAILADFRRSSDS